MSRNYIFHNSEGLCFKDLLDNIVAFKERPHERIRAAAGVKLKMVNLKK